MNKMKFADYFFFTQFSLATFDNCPLKFKKRYVENLKWENITDEDAKIRLEKGNDFHLLANRYFLGIETNLDSDIEENNDLSLWTDNLKKSFPNDKNSKFLPEYKLRMASDDLKIEANFDLLQIKDDKVVIWDWKTHGDSEKNSKNSKVARLKESLQTVVYMFVLKELSYKVLGKDIGFDKIKMCYWQPEPAKILVEIDYNADMHEYFRNILIDKLKYIRNYDFTSFNKENYTAHCKFCEFNWFCNNERIDIKAVCKDEDFLENLYLEKVEELF